MEFGIIYGNGEREIMHNVVEFGKCDALLYDSVETVYYFALDNNEIERVYYNEVKEIELLER